MERRDFLRGLAVVGICPICVGLAQGAEGVHWSYDGEAGPAHWGDLVADNTAGSVGAQQSPINLTGTTPAELPKIHPAWASGVGTMVNNGHTIQVNVPQGSTLTRGDRDYELVQFHFHTPSKHLVEGQPFAMEAHFVHKHIGTNDLGVLGVLLTPGASNATFAQLAAAFPAEPGEAPLDSIDPNGLLPTSLDYWAYEGSLTTPPCSENVDWMVANEPVTIDPADIAKFTTIYAANARPVVPANRRFVLSSI